TLHKIRDTERAFRSRLPFVDWPEFLSEQRSDVGLCAVAITDISQFGRTLLPDNLAIFQHVITPAAIPRAARSPDVTRLLSRHRYAPLLASRRLTGRDPHFCRSSQSRTSFQSKRR